ncbi:MAG: ornithine carbamoyltransferase, partial [Dehalococcoidia bacterium]
MLGRDFLSIADYSPDEIRLLLDAAVRLKARGRPEILTGRTLAMIFEKPSLRTRVSFQVAMTDLGGHAIYLSQEEVGLGVREP